MDLIGEIPPGSLDIVGDVHGEIGALDDLLAHLGYADHGDHPDARRLIFVGDLVDRGPDSPAVLRRVMSLVAAGRAQCIVGNHELNLLRDVAKHGNDWWVNPAAPGEFPAAPVALDARAGLRDFLAGLPLALERADLRIVHACWNAGAVAMLRARQSGGAAVRELYDEYEQRLHRRWSAGPTAAALAADWRRYGRRLRDPDWQAVLVPTMGRMDRDYQMENPVRILTSGEECLAAEPFWAGGRWRMVERVRWWRRYAHRTPVIVGHYWRRFSQAGTVYADKYGPDLFAGVAPHQWLGPRRNVYCVDFSVGGRYAQRAGDQPTHYCSLAALRVPEWQVMHDDGRSWAIGPPGALA
ncbi:MAG: metallophosphoesterase [Gammaproteobacteria bacterium]